VLPENINKLELQLNSSEEKSFKIPKNTKEINVTQINNFFENIDIKLCGTINKTTLELIEKSFKYLKILYLFMRMNDDYSLSIKIIIMICLCANTGSIYYNLNEKINHIKNIYFNKRNYWLFVGTEAIKKQSQKKLNKINEKIKLCDDNDKISKRKNKLIDKKLNLIDIINETETRKINNMDKIINKKLNIIENWEKYIFGKQQIRFNDNFLFFIYVNFLLEIFVMLYCRIIILIILNCMIITINIIKNYNYVINDKFKLKNIPKNVEKITGHFENKQLKQLKHNGKLNIDFI